MPTVMDWLAQGLPLTLICDLVSTADPDSSAINLAERPPGDALLLEAADPRVHDRLQARYAG